jgi:ketosteroid isomerase-like protein
MSLKNVELVQTLIAESNEAQDVVLSGVHPDVEWHLDSNHPDQRVLRGVDDVAAYFRQWLDAFDGVRIDVDDYVDRGDYVVMPFVAYGRLRRSTAEVPLAETWVFTVRNGFIVEVREYLTLDEALNATED